MKQDVFKIVPVEPSTLFVTHICEGEEVVSGDDDGQTWVATFSSRLTAHTFIGVAQELDFIVYGQRRIA